MDIVTLVENSCHDSRLRGEFGLSLLVQCAHATILFDMGASSLFAENAAILGVDLEGVDCAVLSHAHYDHGGGMEAFFDINKHSVLYHGQGVAGGYYGHVRAKIPTLLQPLAAHIPDTLTFCRYIGVESAVLTAQQHRLDGVSGCREICPHVFVLTDICADYALPAGNTFLLEEVDGALQKDRFLHELILVVVEEDGLVIFTGCGHRGILNMVQTVRHHFSDVPIKGVVGGFHLARRPGKPDHAGTAADIAQIADVFDQVGVRTVATGHCTGAGACDILRQRLDDRFVELTTGRRFSL